jgi:hypothetical protein
MATNTLIQKLYGADESGVGEDSGSQSNRRQVETFIAKTAIALGAPVGFDFAGPPSAGELIGKVVETNTGTAATVSCIGVALNAAAAGARVDVCLSGVCEARLANATLVGHRLKATNANYFDNYTAGDTVPVIAYAVDDQPGANGNMATVVVIKQF